MELITTKGDVNSEDDSRGQHRDGQQRDIVARKQVQRNQLEVCPGLVSGDTHPMCRGHNRGDLEPRAGDAAGEDGTVAEKTPGLPRSERDNQSKRNSGGSGSATQPDPAMSDGRQGGKKKHRRSKNNKKKRRWKPYYKLSWEEKKELDERETIRASRVREEMFAKGLPVAPYNTTQFLMDEHDREEPDLNTELGAGGQRRSFGAIRSEDTASEEDYFEQEEEEDEEADCGSDGMGRPGQAGGAFLQKDFSETYERYHVETLQNMSKQELVQEYLELEKCMSRLEEENNRLRNVQGGGAEGTAGEGETPGPAAATDGAQRLRELESELERLKAQNSELLQQSQRYREQGINGATQGTDTGQQPTHDGTK